MSKPRAQTTDRWIQRADGRSYRTGHCRRRSPRSARANRPGKCFRFRWGKCRRHIGEDQQMSGAAVIITGLGLEIPGIQDTANLLDALKAPVEASEFIPADKLGRQGLRYKDRATKLALCAAQTALTNAGLPTSAATQITPETFGVVVSSNLGMWIRCAACWTQFTVRERIQ